MPAVRLAWRRVADGMPRREVAWQLIRELAGVDLDLDNPCPRCGGPHGPVRVLGAPIRAAVTYARDREGTIAVAGIVPVDHAEAFAIDAEWADRDTAGAFGPGRIPTVRDWVRVESALKADGRGLRVDPATVVVSPGGPAWQATIPGRADALHGIDLDGPVGVLVSAAFAARPEESAPPATA